MKTIFELPSELRDEIYKLALESASISIVLPVRGDCHKPLSLLLTTKAVRCDVLSLIYRHGNIHARVLDLNLEGLLAFMTRLNTQQRAAMHDNPNLEIHLRRTEPIDVDAVIPSMHVSSLKEWVVHVVRTDRLQPCWKYTGPFTNHQAAARLRREAVQQDDKEKQEYARIYAVWGIFHCS